MKAVILAGGRGERLDTTGNKCMTYYHGEPILYQSINNAIEHAEVDEIIMLVGYKPDLIINHFGTSYKKTSILYAFQPEPHGIVDAISCCRDYIKKDDFLLMLGDEIIIKPNHKRMINYYKRNKCSIVCGVVEEENHNKISKTYNFINSGSRIHRLIEKPTHIFNNFMGTGNIVFSNHVLDYIEKTPINTRRGRQEKELVDLIQCAIDEGERVDWFVIGEKYENVNDEECLYNLVNWG